MMSPGAVATAAGDGGNAPGAAATLSEPSATPSEDRDYGRGIAATVTVGRLTRLYVKHRGDGLDLDQLVLVAEHGDAEQGAGDVMRAE
jgi:hypothetical protein